jgi:hypothetical protein
VASGSVNVPEAVWLTHPKQVLECALLEEQKSAVNKRKGFTLEVYHTLCEGDEKYAFRLSARLYLTEYRLVVRVVPQARLTTLKELCGSNK